MTLIRLDQISYHIGPQVLLDHAALEIAAGERVCVLGRNGAGKSTLLRIIEGELQPEEGQVWRKPQLRYARLVQELPNETDLSVYDLVAGGDPRSGTLLQAYHDTAVALERGHDEALLRRMDELQRELEAHDGWGLKQRVESLLERLQLSGDTRVGELSGGWKRRAMLARALAGDPELLLLDEPTNHMDVAAIEWMEEWLAEYRGGVVFITHDRALLRRLATRIVELDRGWLTSWPGDYDNYLRRRDERLNAEEKDQQRFDKKLAQEEVWIRQGIKARRTRNEGRVRALQAMREERRQRRDHQGQARLNLDRGEASGKLVVEAEGVSHAWDGQTYIRELDLRLVRGDRLGLVGPNGSGKTTLIEILLGELTPDEGKVRTGTKLQVAYFDQLRAQLDPDKSIMDNIADGRETIEINGQPRHLISYLGDFLFTAERARTPVRALSGGESNRAMLAKLFSKPANLLVMDEPTNDLDLETLELLEELLAQYQGTLILVSHDRAFLDNVVTSCLVFGQQGQLTEVVGGYQECLPYLQRESAQLSTQAPKKSAPAASPSKPKGRRKLSYKDQRELEQLPAQIEQLEQQVEQWQSRTADPAFYQKSQDEINAGLAQLQQCEAELETSYARWDALESQQAALAE